MEILDTSRGVFSWVSVVCRILCANYSLSLFPHVPHTLSLPPFLSFSQLQRTAVKANHMGLHPPRGGTALVEMGSVLPLTVTMELGIEG